jgi:hypothetical protein
MTLTMDPGERQVTEYECPCCNAPIQRTWNYIYRDGKAFAVYFANSYHHLDQPHETWIDAIFGTWNEDRFDDHVTFGCRVVFLDDRSGPAAGLVQACLDGSGGPVHGVRLSREEALAHPWLPDFWQVVDFVLAEDPLVHAHLYGPQWPGDINATGC